ncbi:uncharacterized protein LOC115760256 [Drosophila novamexicana]|uniref:uncharacterized protein LOC115760256 n=1 Tax=Drosophila novamexicana TaxID=47314 RepID=UPI0011E5CBD3|nr:uncharacterized protein LOC115760256 [Drosophila novamexicana]
MAWAPSTNFEDDLVDLEPNCNFIYGQLAYEAKRKQEYTPRPKSTYEYLANRQKRNEEIDKVHSSKSKEIRASLAMMERIQQIAGTKPLGEHATMSDWDDTSTVEKEAVAMMRHFGMMSMTDGSLAPPKTEPLPHNNIHVIRNGRRNFPLILDPQYFEPGKTRKMSNSSYSSATSGTNTSRASESGSSASIYTTADSHIEETDSSQDDQGFDEIPYTLLEETLEPKLNSPKPYKTKKTRGSRPPQSPRLQMATTKRRHRL